MIWNVGNFDAIKFQLLDGATWKYKNQPCGIMKKIGWKFFYNSNIDLGHPLLAFILNGFKLGHVAL
jgi:hypothetical protein